MRTLPVVEREMRTAARQTRTWWWRFLTVAAAFGFFLFALLTVGNAAPANRVGTEVFTALSVFGMIYALVSGPLATADCLGRERREGTLGLLFLTHLRAHDVVLGKMASASLDMLLGLGAAVPFVAVPFLLGGLSLSTFFYVSAALVNLMVMSLALGACASAIFASARAALALSLGLLLFMTFGLPLLGEICGDIHPSSEFAPVVYALCPLYTMDRCWSAATRPPGWQFWLNMGCLHLFAWGCIAFACCRTARSWRDLPAAPARARLAEWLGRWRRGSRRRRASWKARMLGRNPIAWLEGRDRTQPIALAVLVGLTFAGFLISAMIAGTDTADEGVIILFAFIAHNVLCLWVAIQAPRRLGDDRQSGALELLLSTPLPPRQIVQGTMRILRRRFGLALLALMLLDAMLVASYLYFGRGYSPLESAWWRHELSVLALSALFVCPAQVYVFARVGIYQGLVQTNPLRATFMLIWKIGILPWACFIAFIAFYESAWRRFFGWPFRFESICAVWAVIHLVLCLAFLAHAEWHLRRNFRRFAASLPAPFWKRAVRSVLRGRHGTTASASTR